MYSLEMWNTYYHCVAIAALLRLTIDYFRKAKCRIFWAWIAFKQYWATVELSTISKLNVNVTKFRIAFVLHKYSEQEKTIYGWGIFVLTNRSLWK